MLSPWQTATAEAQLLSFPPPVNPGGREEEQLKGVPRGLIG